MRRDEGQPPQDEEPVLPVLDLLGDEPAPRGAAAPVLATLHGRPVGLLPPTAADLRADGLALFADDVAAHLADGEPCGWAAALGTERPGATVVLTTVGDRPHGLAVAIDRLLQQTYAPLEVVVVDNRPGTWDASGLEREGVRVVQEQVRGISAARNAGLAATTTPVVLFTDDDVVPSEDWVGWIVAALWRDPEVVCATGLILPLEVRTDGQRLLEEWGGFSKGLVAQTHPLPEPPHPLYPYLPGAYGSGGNVGFRADALRALGGYDVALGAGTPAHGGEDLAMQLDVVLSGHRLAYEPAAVIWHRHRASAREWRRQLFRYGTGLSAAMVRHAVTRPGSRRAIVSRLPAASVYALSPRSGKNVGRSRSYPKLFVLAELAGMAYGPIALWRSVRVHRAGRR